MAIFRVKTFSMRIALIIFLSFISILSYSQKPPDGTYTYKVAFDEWGGRSLGATVTVVIKGDSIRVIHNGRPGLSGKKGEVIDAGIILKHSRTGKWIIGKKKEDVNAAEIGGCSDGPSVIDFKRKIFRLC